MKTLTIATAACLLVSAPACAQNVIHWSVPQPAADQGRLFYVPQGTPIALATRTEISSRHSKPGERVYFYVTQDVTFRGQTVVPMGAVAVGEVVSAQRNGILGRKGKIAVRLLHIETPYGRVGLTGRAADEGKSGTAASIVTMALVSGLGFLIHGTSANIPEGTPVEAYLAQPLQFAWNGQDANVEVADAQPATRREPPARFDPSVFGGNGPGPGFQ